MACKATLKVDDILFVKDDKIGKIKEAADLPDEEYSDADYKKDLAITYVQTGADFVKLYSPAVGLGIISISLLLGSHDIMKKRNVALMAAYKTLDQAFGDYRKRVVETYGTQTDSNFKNGIRDEKITVVEVDENGVKKKVKKTVGVVDPNHHSQYAKFFDETCSSWQKNPEYNLLFLKNQQNYANDLLKSRGHLFLNEVYDMIGVPRTSAGSIVGWVIGDGDNFIDFGMYDMDSEVKRQFVNGYERSILLDFNVDGVIYDLI